MGSHHLYFKEAMFSILVIFYLNLLLAEGSGQGAIPSWVNLSCQPGHKYLFSNTGLVWTEAMVECQLYGGYLLHIDNRREQNCLLNYALNSTISGTYFHDGKLFLNIKSKITV